jgi:hypothetical protein
VYHGAARVLDEISLLIHHLEVLYFEILVENGNVKIQDGWRFNIDY